jgi:hypothetical protein
MRPRKECQEVVVCRGQALVIADEVATGEGCSPEVEWPVGEAYLVVPASSLRA